MKEEVPFAGIRPSNIQPPWCTKFPFPFAFSVHLLCCLQGALHISPIVSLFSAENEFSIHSPAQCPWFGANTTLKHALKCSEKHYFSPHARLKAGKRPFECQKSAKVVSDPCRAGAGHRQGLHQRSSSRTVLLFSS